MNVVLPAIACGWLLGLALAGLLSSDLPTLSRAKRTPVLATLWDRSPMAAMVVAAMAVILLPGTVIGLLVSLVYIVELSLLSGVSRMIVLAAHAGLFLGGAAIFCLWALRGRPAHRRSAAIGMIFGIVFGIFYPLLAY